MKCYAVYVIENLVNGKKYVGQSLNPDHRKKEHFAPGARRSIVSRAIQKYGKDAFRFEVIATGFDKINVDEIEQAMIIKLNTIAPHGYNVLPGGQTTKEGFKASAETRLKMSKTRKGRKHSQDWCKNISESLRGRKLSEDCKAKLSAALKGRSVPDDVRVRMSRGHRGRWTETMRQIERDRIRNKWADPAYRSMMMAARS